MNERLLSIRPTWRHAALEKQIVELEVGRNVSRTAITQRAIEAAKNVTTTNWGEIAARLASLKQTEGEIPNLMQMRVDSDACEIIKKKMKDDLSLNRPPTSPYFVLLLWQNYVEFLKERTLRAGKPEAGKPEAETPLSAPEMIKTLAEMLFLRREEDQPTIEMIQKILLDWKKRK